MKRIGLGVLVAMWLGFCAQAAVAATVTWDGEGADENWTTVENWSADQLPGTADHVIFDATSATNCTLDANVEVASLEVTDGYAGTIDFGTSHTLSITSADLDLSHAGGPYVELTGQFVFTGSTDQAFRYYSDASVGAVENAKGGGTLDFDGGNIELNDFTAGAGTITAFTSSTFTVKNLTLQGTAGSEAEVRSRTAGNPTELHLTETQRIAYARFQDIHAIGLTVDATDDCIDGGGNTNVYFDGLRSWDGEGGDGNWSTAANWSEDRVPGPFDDVVFDETSDINCTLDITPIEVASLTIAETYGGMVTLGDALIIVNEGDFASSPVEGGHFDRGTSTIRFTGEEDQHLFYADRYKFWNVENRNTDGQLIMCDHEYPQSQGWNITLNTLDGGPGTSTTSGTLTTLVRHLILAGEPGNLATLAGVNLLLLDSQQVSYARFGGVDASLWPQGQPVDATNNCVKVGSTKAVYFDGLCSWDGGGADENWSTPENWTHDTVPAVGDAILFNGTGGTKDCVLDVDAEISDLLLYSAYGGTFRGGSKTLTYTGKTLNIANDAITQFEPENGTIELRGSEQMRIQVPENQSFGTLVVGSAGAQFVNGFRAETLTIEPGAEVWFAGHDPAYPAVPPQITNVESFNCTGTSEAPVTLYPAIDHADEGFHYVDFFADFHLTVGSSATVAYAEVLNCQAGGGVTIDGTNGCIDLGGNENWTFAPHTGIKIPSMSTVSPISVEGRRQGDGSASITLSSSAEPEKPVVFAGNHLWHENADLSVAGDTTVTVKADSSTIASGTVTWEPTDLSGKNPQDHQIVLRKDDSLLLTASGSGTVEIDPYGTGTYTEITEPLAALYDTPGAYTAAARVNGADVGSVQVRVVDIDLDPTDPLAARVGSRRDKEIPVLGGEPEDVFFTAANPAEIEVTHLNPSDPSQVAFRLLPLQRGDGYFFVARLEDESGPIVRTQEIKTFTLDFTTKTRNPVFEQYSDGDALVGAGVLMEPWYPALKIQLEMLSGGSVFENGSTEYWIHTNDFDQNGQSNVYIISSASAIVCHFARVVADE
jgi:hypothetical protein